MKLIYCLILCLFFSACNKNTDEPLPYLVQYKAQVITPENFLKKLIIQSYIKYKEQRTDKLKESANLESLKKETLALLIQEIFVNDLANKKSIFIKDDELKDWINKRSQGTKTENLNLFLNSNGLKLSDWNRMFKNQLLMHKVKEFLDNEGKEKAPDDKSTQAKSKTLKTHVHLGVISYDDKHEAETAYTRIRRGQTNFLKLMKSKTGGKDYQWLIEEELPFIEEVKKLRLKTVSKVLQTDWGYSLIMINKREKKPAKPADNASGQASPNWSVALKDFKESPDLKINFDLFYGLKLKK